MKDPCLFIFSILLSITVQAQTIYSKAFGDPKAKPVVFLHGGPGYTCANFEATTAQTLADNGYYLVVYDRRAEGRSINMKAAFTFKETFSDLNSIFKKYKIKQANFIGHSFGGMVAILYAKAYPKKVSSVVLVGAPVSLQETFYTIIASCKNMYAVNKDTTTLTYINMIDKMDRNSMEYASYCFYYAMKSGFYSPKNMTDDAKKRYDDFGKSELFKEAIKMTVEPPQGFSANEKYTSLDLSADIKGLVAQQVKVYGLYGKDDGLYSEKQVMDLKSILGASNLKYLENCSHNVFIDQQEEFIITLQTWIK